MRRNLKLEEKLSESINKVAKSQKKGDTGVTVSVNETKTVSKPLVRGQKQTEKKAAPSTTKSTDVQKKKEVATKLQTTGKSAAAAPKEKTRRVTPGLGLPLR